METEIGIAECNEREQPVTKLDRPSLDQGREVKRERALRRANVPSEYVSLNSY